MLIGKKRNAGKNVCTFLLFQEPEDTFFLRSLLFTRQHRGLRHMPSGPGFAFCLQFVSNERKVGIALQGSDLLVLIFKVWRRRFRDSRRPGIRGHIVPRFPFRIGNDDRGLGSGRFLLHDDDRRLPRVVYCLNTRGVERRPAAVAEERLALGVGSSACRAGTVPGERFLFKGSATAGAEARLVIEGGVTAAAAYDRHRRYFCAAPVTELCQFIGYDRAASGADRERGSSLFGHNSAAPVAELRPVIERRVAAFTTGFCHVLH
jgi:hypothetical protein